MELRPAEGTVRRKLARLNFINTMTEWTWHAGVAVIVFLFAAVGAFQSPVLGGFSERLGFFACIATIMFAAGLLFSTVLTFLAGRLVFGNLKMQLLVSVPTALAGFCAERSLEMFLSGQPTTTMTSPEILGSFLILAPAGTILFHFMHYLRLHFRRETAPAMPVSFVSLPGKNLCDQAPVYMEADDHLVKIVYPDRIEMKRSKLSGEMETWAGCGMQVHRSFWISRKHVAYRARSGRQLFVVMNSGERIPVGRSYERQVKEFKEG